MELKTSIQPDKERKEREERRAEMDEAYAEFMRTVQLPEPAADSMRVLQFDAIYRMASLDLARERHEDAASLLHRLIELYPGHPNARFAYARALIALGREAEARQVLERHASIPERDAGMIG